MKMTLGKYGFIALVAMLIAATTSPLPSFIFPAEGAERKTDVSDNFIGSVDLDTVLAFHPLMLYFDADLKLFLKPAENLISTVDFNRIVETRNVDFIRSRDANMPEIRRLRSEAAIAAAELAKLGARAEAEINNLNERFKEIIAQADDEKDRQARIEKQQSGVAGLKNEYAVEEKRLKNKLKEISASLDVHLNSLLKHHYLTAAESAGLLARVEKEVLDAIKTVAGREGITVVVNVGSNFGDEQSGPKKSGKNLMDVIRKNDDTLTAGPSYTNICNFLMPAVPERKKTEKGPADNFAVKADGLIKKRLNKNADYFKGLRILKESGIGDLRDSFIVTGGSDITAKVIVHILKKNGIQSENAAAVEKFIINY